MKEFRLVRATGLEELYERAGWTAGDGTAHDRRLADFMFRNLRDSAYALSGYGSVEEILAGDIGMIRRYASAPESDVHLCLVLEREELRAFMLWYSLEAGGPSLLPPEDRTELASLRDCRRSEIAYGDWLIIDRSARMDGLGGVLFAVLLNDMARSGYKFWYGRTVIPANLGLYERLYHRKGRAQLIGTWRDGTVTRIGFMGDLRGGWTEQLLRTSIAGKPDFQALV